MLEAFLERLSKAAEEAQEAQEAEPAADHEPTEREFQLFYVLQAIQSAYDQGHLPMYAEFKSEDYALKALQFGKDRGWKPPTTEETIGIFWDWFMHGYRGDFCMLMDNHVAMELYGNKSNPHAMPAGLRGLFGK